MRALDTILGNLVLSALVCGFVLGQDCLAQKPPSSIPAECLPSTSVGTRSDPQSLSVLSWNVLAPHLLIRFWDSYTRDNRSSLPPSDPDLAQIVDAKSLAVAATMADMVARRHPDIVTLQEATVPHSISVPGYPLLEDALRRSNDPLACELDRLGYTQLAAASKPATKKWNWRPRGASVATARGTTAVITYGRIEMRVSDISGSDAGAKTPMTLVHLPEWATVVVSVHAAMNFPHIDAALHNVSAIMAQHRRRQNISPDTTIIVIGDLNAGTHEANQDWSDWVTKNGFTPLVEQRHDDQAAVAPGRNALLSSMAFHLHEYDRMVLEHSTKSVEAAELNLAKMFQVGSSTLGTAAERVYNGATGLAQRFLTQLSHGKKMDWKLHGGLFVSDHRPLWFQMQRDPRHLHRTTAANGLTT